MMCVEMSNNQWINSFKVSGGIDVNVDKKAHASLASYENCLTHTIAYTCRSIHIHIPSTSYIHSSTQSDQCIYRGQSKTGCIY